jgi:Ca2+/Na+ antiporter
MCSVANYLMAKAGYGTTALAAVYAGPMFNLMFGLGVAGIVGTIKYGKGLPVVPEVQLYIGTIFIVICLSLGVFFSSTKRFTKQHAYVFFAVYAIFLIVTVSVNLG